MLLGHIVAVELFLKMVNPCLLYTSDAADDAPLNTETPGSTIDRLSIMSLRIYHLQEQLDRDDVTQEHFDSVNRKLAVCKLQQSDLKQSLEELLADIFSGKKRHRTYRQFKMYNCLLYTSPSPRDRG